jgi:formate hydrogenlyase subunit 4
MPPHFGALFLVEWRRLALMSALFLAPISAACHIQRIRSNSVAVLACFRNTLIALITGSSFEAFFPTLRPQTEQVPPNPHGR